MREPRLLDHRASALRVARDTVASGSCGEDVAARVEGVDDDPTHKPGALPVDTPRRPIQIRFDH